MSLKEEISEATRVLLYHPPYPENFNEGVNKHVDLLISKIENRIDVLEQKIPTCTAQDGRTTSFHSGQRRMIEKVKDMLK